MWVERIDKGGCNKGFIWNPSNCDCECNKSCDFGEYSDYKNFKCRKRLIDKLVEECSENIDGNKIMYYGALSDYNSIEDFHSDLLKRYKKSCKNNDIYYIGYITIKTISDYENIRIVHPLYLVIG